MTITSDTMFERVPNEWWKDFYDDAVEAFLLNKPSADFNRQTVDFLIEHLGLAPKSRVFDQCCGNGRLSLEFAARGFDVEAVEWNATYVQRAKARANERSRIVHVAVGDARHYRCEIACDGGFNWWTSFAYDRSDDVNGLMLQRAYESLRPGARYAIDFPNAAAILRHFRASEVDRTVMNGHEWVLIRESQIEWPSGMLCKRWEYLGHNGERRVQSSEIRLYTPAELAHLLQRAGFRHVEFFGDLDGQHLTIDSPRCIVIAEKAGT